MTCVFGTVCAWNSIAVARAPPKCEGCLMVLMSRTSRLNMRTIAVAVLLIGIAMSAGAGTITATNYTMPDGSTTVQIYDSIKAPEGTAPGSATVTDAMINLQTSIGTLQTYCVDLFDYISPGTNYTFNQNPLSTAGQYSNGATNVNWTQAQVNLITRLLTNGTLQTQSLVNTTALQIAIWAAEYDTAAANGSYNITASDSFYFTATADSNSAAAIAQAQTYLNDATGYQNGASWVNAIWLSNSTHFVQYLTGTGVQNLVYLATPEPSTVAVLGMSLLALAFVRRRKVL